MTIRGTKPMPSMRRSRLRREQPVQTQTIWMAFDLGVRGDYESLYAWLDEHKALECGDGVAMLKVNFRSDLPTALNSSLKRAGIQIGLRDRIYIIYTRDGRAM